MTPDRYHELKAMAERSVIRDGGIEIRLHHGMGPAAAMLLECLVAIDEQRQWIEILEAERQK